MMKNVISEKYRKNSDIIFVCLCAAAVLAVMWTFTGQWPWRAEAYNSYILQARSWLQGRLDLGQDYPYLELAIFDGKYFVSFPPFPSYVMLPFVMLRWYSCDSMIAFAFAMGGVVYAYKLSETVCKNKSRQLIMLFALFVTIGSNWLMTAQNAWVWFIAQNMAFTLSLMALYYAIKNKAGLSLMFWACAVGCRPLQILYIPVILYLLYKAHKDNSPSDKLADIIKKRWSAAIPMVIIALSYMILNYARFGSIIEFGHNYLPEFMRVEEGQFHISYVFKNIKSLIYLPSAAEGKLQYPMGDGMSVFVISPIFISYVIYTVRSFVKKTEKDMWLIIMVFIPAIIELLLITAHKTMGGAHFGNRYTNDILPLVFVGMLSVIPEKNTLVKFNYPLFFFGLTLNVVGIISFLT